MALDWPAFGNALWAVSDKLGIRPEWQLPVLYLETGGTFSPAIMNANGCVGLNQFCPVTYPSYVHVPVSDYRTWSASQQLAGPILNYWRDALQYGPIRSSTRLMVSQFGQGHLATTPSLDSVVLRGADAAQNPGFDAAHKGYITVRDIANVMAQKAAMPAVQQAIAAAYAMRPGEKMKNPVYGDDYMLTAEPPAKPPRIIPPSRPPESVVLATVGAIMLGVAAGYAVDKVLSGAIRLP
jgi:hypothetical protein